MTRERLLVVDDEPDFAAFVRRVAESQGLEVRVTLSARDFKAVYPGFDPTVIVMDIVMPELDGIELMQWLVQNRCAARIIIMSGYSPEYAKAAELIAQVRGALSVVSLQKPVPLATLEAALAGRPHRPSRYEPI